MVDVVDQPQALVSYHLGRLRAGGLVTSRRSSKDGRAVYYHLELDRFGASISSTGSLLHPGLHLVLPTVPATLGHRHRKVVRVLFVCTGNSARSQIAEALLSAALGSEVHVVSAGSDPKPVHPLAVKVLAARGIDISEWRSKPLGDFAAERFDYVITLCDKVRERCPEFRGDGEAMHWSIEDPGAGLGRVAFERFERTTDDLGNRVRWLTWLVHTSQPTGGTPHDN